MNTTELLLLFNRPLHPVHLRGFSYRDSSALVASLCAAIQESGGWVLENTPVSAAVMEMRAEMQSRDVLDFYASVLSAGLELTRKSHLALMDLCTCRYHLTSTASQKQIIPIRIDISFLNHAVFTASA